MTVEAQVVADPGPEGRPGRTSDERDSLLADMANLDDDGNVAAPPPEAHVDLTQETAPEAAAQEETAEVEPEESTAEAEVETAPEEEKPDPVKAALAARDVELEKEHKQEKRFNERMTEQRAEFKREQDEHAELLAEAQQIKADHAAASRRAFDPRDKSPEELMQRARELHAMSVANSADATPAQKAEAQRLSRDRSIEDRLSAAETESKELRAQLKERDQATMVKEQSQKMTAHLVSSVTEETPFTQRALKGKGKDEAAKRMLNIAAYLYEQSDETPDAIDVFRIYEQSERAFFEERGLDPDAVLQGSATATPKTNTPVAVEKKSASLGNDLGNTTTPRSEPMTDDELREDILKGMANLG